MEKQFYTASEAQAKLGLSRTEFHRRVNQKLIPKVTRPGMKQGVYPKRDIDALALSMNIVFEQHEKIVFSKSSPADQVEELEIAARAFGSDLIIPLPERIALQQKNEFTFMSLKAYDHVVGFTAIHRLTPSFLDDILTGRKIDRDINAKETLPFTRLEPIDIYLSAITVDIALPNHLRHFYAGTIISKSIDTLLSLRAREYQINNIYAVSTTKEGDKLAKKMGFQELKDKSLVKGRTAYKYTLDEEGIKNFQKLSGRKVT